MLLFLKEMFNFATYMKVFVTILASLCIASMHAADFNIKSYLPKTTPQYSLRMLYNRPSTLALLQVVVVWWCLLVFIRLVPYN